MLKAVQGMAGVQAMAAVTAVLAIACWAAPAAAQVTMREVTTYYDISGKTGQKLQDDLKRKAPSGGEGALWFARTDWHVDWSYRFDKGWHSCRLRDISVRVTVEYRMPRWQGRAGASNRLVQYWDRFEAALWTHERGHADIGLRAGEAVQSALANLPEARSCDALGRQATETALALTSGNGEDEAYDRRTGHGRSQGAWFDAAAADGR